MHTFLFISRQTNILNLTFQVSALFHNNLLTGGQGI